MGGGAVRGRHSSVLIWGQPVKAFISVRIVRRLLRSLHGVGLDHTTSFGEWLRELTLCLAVQSVLLSYILAHSGRHLSTSLCSLRWRQALVLETFTLVSQRVW